MAFHAEHLADEICQKTFPTSIFWWANSGTASSNTIRTFLGSAKIRSSGPVNHLLQVGLAVNIPPNDVRPSLCQIRPNINMEQDQTYRYPTSNVLFFSRGRGHSPAHPHHPDPLHLLSLPRHTTRCQGPVQIAGRR